MLMKGRTQLALGQSEWCDHEPQPRSGERMQPTEQAVGTQKEVKKPRRGERKQTRINRILRRVMMDGKKRTGKK